MKFNYAVFAANEAKAKGRKAERVVLNAKGQAVNTGHHNRLFTMGEVIAAQEAQGYTAYVEAMKFLDATIGDDSDTAIRNAFDLAKSKIKDAAHASSLKEKLITASLDGSKTALIGFAAVSLWENPYAKVDFGWLTAGQDELIVAPKSPDVKREESKSIARSNDAQAAGSTLQKAFAISDKVEADGGSHDEADEAFDRVMSEGATISAAASNIALAMEELDKRSVKFDVQLPFLQELAKLSAFDDYNLVRRAINQTFPTYKSAPKADLSWLKDDDEYEVGLFDAVDMYDMSVDQLDELVAEFDGVAFTDTESSLTSLGSVELNTVVELGCGNVKAGVRQPETARWIRGMVIAQDGGVSWGDEKNNRFFVESSSGVGGYSVTRLTSTSDSLVCECPDHVARCKHICAVEIVGGNDGFDDIDDIDDMMFAFEIQL